MSATDFLLWLQGWRNPALDAFFAAMTFIGSEEFILAFLALVYWCVDRTTGLRLGMVLIGSQYLNEALKAWANTPRPGPPIIPRNLDTAQGAAWPSGHAQNTAAVWGTFAALLRRPALTALAVAVILLVGFSRLYLGLHWPVDVVSGWLIGAGIALLTLLLVARYGRLDAARFPLWALAAAVIVTAALLYIQPTETTGKLLGAGLGLVIGWWLERRTVGFEAPAPLAQQIIKALIGLVIVFVLRLALKPILGGLPIALLPDLARYLIMGLWVAWLAPLLFMRMGLLGRARSTALEER